MNRLSLLVVPGALLLLTGCESVRAGATSVVVRDSAGIQIVESTAPAWREGEGWSLSAEPVLQIGMLDGPAEYQFDRVVGALRLSDGRIVAGDGGLDALRFYDADGRFLSSTGREGEGPGEFKSMASVQLLPGDSLLTFDFQHRRVSIFGPDGAFVRSVNLTSGPETGFPNVIGRLADGSLLASVGRVFGAGEVKDGHSRDPRSYLRYSSAGEMLDTIATVPGSESFLKTQGSGGFTVTSVLFGKHPVHALLDGRVVLGANDAYELGVYSPTGTLERLVRRGQEPRPVTDADHQAAVAERLEESSPEWRKTLEPMYAEMPRPATMPFYSAVRADDAGNLWVQDFRAPSDEAARWTVFDPEGRMLGQVAMPERFRPTHLGDDFVLGVWEDELDVQYVQMFALHKGR